MVVEKGEVGMPNVCSRSPSFILGLAFILAGFVVSTPLIAQISPARYTWKPTGPVAGMTVQFTDTSTVSATSWAWDFGDPSSGANNTSTLQNPTHIFAAAAYYNVMLAVTYGTGSTASWTFNVKISAVRTTTCTPDTNTLCLNSNRFQLTAQWQKTDGTSGSGSAVPLTAESGYFWFFDPANIELVTKALNGCAVNNNYWVFGAGLTNVQVYLKVLDTSNGASETYFSPLNTAFVPIQDTTAFATCP
jgi:hypothetical protein